MSEFARGGFIAGNGDRQPVFIESWECIITRDRTCARGHMPDHDPENAPGPTSRFWTCTQYDAAVTGEVAI